MSELSFNDLRRAVIVALERAADTLRRLPLPKHGLPSLPRSQWPLAPNDPAEAYGYTPELVPLIPPRARAVSELDRVLPWLAALDGMPDAAKYRMIGNAVPPPLAEAVIRYAIGGGECA